MDSSSGLGPPRTDCGRTPCHYIRRDVATSGDGSSWSAALPDLPAEPERGAVYFVADGFYGQLVLDAPEAGDAWISIVKATEADHGTDVGWDSSYGDGQAVFADVRMVSDFWVLDGRTRDESDWSNTDAYGFRVTGMVLAHVINFGRGSTDVVFRYLDVGAPKNDAFDPSMPSDGFHIGGYDEVLSRWTISRCHIHNVYIPFKIAGASHVTIELSWLGPNWSKETIRGASYSSFITIRHNVMKDGCQGTPGDPTATSCTAQIAIWDGDREGAFDGSEIYGNVIWTTKDTGHSDGCIFVGGDNGTTAHGVSARNVRIYNNTMVGVRSGRCIIRLPGNREGGEVMNNLWYGLGDGVRSGCEADMCVTNVDLTSSPDPFVDSAGGDYRLSGRTPPGTTLPAPYDVDRYGARRGGDGVWDLGAYELVE